MAGRHRSKRHGCNPHRSKARVNSRFESLEDRRVMAADIPVELMAPVSDVVESAPPVEHHTTAEPDFWIDTSTSGSLDDYFHQVEQFLASAHNLTGWAQVRNNYNFTGAGQTVAIIDSGIAYNHFALGGGFGAGYRVVGGWDFTEENDANPYDDGPSGGHGTHVSGIVGSSDATNTGVAPGVDLVGLRVFNDAGQGFFSWMENALRWVHTNRNSFANPITTVNMSLGVSSWNSATIPLWANLEDELAQLKADGIFIAVSAGNSFTSYNAPGLSYPAASPYVVPVMSVDDAGNMSSFSQRLGRAIAAPGQSITSTIPDYKGNNNGIADDFATMGGTSMAAPYIAGASVIIRQAMQSIGMTNINQDTIYNHMMATADSFYDSVTAQTYKRLNLGRAITTLMGGGTPPADDYGNDPATAYNLGNSSGGGINRTGVIGTTSDVDCFKFTATATGRVTFTATAGAGMNPTWQLWGATALSAPAGSVSFNIVAGQTYTVGLSSPNATGNYTITSALAAADPFTYTDWGSVAFNTVDNVAVNGDRWYRIQPTRNGLLTVCGTFNAGGGNANVALYDGNLSLVANGSTAGGLARVDGTVIGGGYYYVKVSGANSDVDFKLANLVSQSGLTVTVNGTSGNDTVAFTAGTTSTVVVNGIGYTFNASAANTFNLSVGLGVDTVTVTGKSTAETVVLRAGTSEVSGVGYAVNVFDAESQTINGNGGADVLSLYDSVGNDGLELTQTQAKFTYAGGVTSTAVGFAQVTAYSNSGSDYVDMYDSAGNDLVSLWSDRVLMTGTGFSRDVRGFDIVAAHAYAGGFDRATYYDSAGNDAFTSWSNRALMTGVGYANHALGFEVTVATAGSGGTDTAVLNDSSGNDALAVAGKYARLAYSTGVVTEATGFGQITAYASTGFDYVDVYDTSGADTATMWSDRTLMTGAGYSNDVRGFDLVAAHSWSGGADVLNLYDSAGDDDLQLFARKAVFNYAGGARAMADGFGQVTAYSTAGFDFVDMYDTVGNDTATLWSDRGTMTGTGYNNDVRNFDIVAAHAWFGGSDVANLYDSTGNDGLQLFPRRAVLTYASGAKSMADAFAKITAYSSGGFDYVDLYDSIGNDVASLWADRATMVGPGFANEVRGFDLVAAHAWYGGNDRANFYDSIGNDTYSAWSNRASMTGTGYDNRADAFDQYAASASSGGNDASHAYGSAGADSLTGSGRTAVFSGVGFRHDLSDFDSLVAHALNGSDTVNVGATDYAFSQLGS